MSQTTDAPADSRFAAMYVSLTGRETFTDQQREDDTPRVADATDRDVSAYVADAARETGLEDAIAEPEDD